MTDKFTPWFRVGFDDPVRPGLYQVSIGGNGKRHFLARWDGERWHPGRPFGAASDYQPVAVWRDRWRGLTSPASDDLPSDDPPDAQEAPQIAF